MAPAAPGSAGRCLEALLQTPQLGHELGGEMIAEAGEVLLDERNLGAPGRDVHLEQSAHRLGRHIDPAGVDGARAGSRPIGVSTAAPSPETRSKIHFSTRLFSP